MPLTHCACALSRVTGLTCIPPVTGTAASAAPPPAPLRFFLAGVVAAASSALSSTPASSPSSTFQKKSIPPQSPESTCCRPRTATASTLFSCPSSVARGAWLLLLPLPPPPVASRHALSTRSLPAVTTVAAPAPPPLVGKAATALMGPSCACHDSRLPQSTAPSRRRTPS